MKIFIISILVGHFQFYYLTSQKNGFLLTLADSVLKVPLSRHCFVLFTHSDLVVRLTDFLAVRFMSLTKEVS
ncbi:MAG: hypothetical protein DRN14_02760 [Thermoplasmata archaeon]|nr:MAG: hypothetical protein DRN14_02760 [Thermoplasmata archaeon]